MDTIIQWFGTRQQLGKHDTVALFFISAALVSENCHAKSRSSRRPRTVNGGPHHETLTSLFLPPAPYSRRASFIDSQCTAHSRARIRMLSTRFLQHIRYSGHTRTCLIVCSRSWTPLLDPSSKSRSSASSRQRSAMNCIGFLSAYDSFSSSAFSSEAAWPVQLRPISPNFVSWFLPSRVVVKICARLPRVPKGGATGGMGGTNPPTPGDWGDRGDKSWIKNWEFLQIFGKHYCYLDIQ